MIKRARTQLQEVTQRFIKNNINKTNKNYPVGEKQAGQGIQQPTTTNHIWQRTHTELNKHREILKGANEKDNEEKTDWENESINR